MTVLWWVFPVIFFGGGIIMLVRSYVKSKGQPEWVGEGPLVLPNLAGSGSQIFGVILIILSLVFLAGRYLR